MDPEGSMTVIHSMEIGRPDRPPWHHYCFPVKWAEIGGVHAVGSTVMWGIMSQFLSRVCVRDGSNLFFYIYIFTLMLQICWLHKRRRGTSFIFCIRTFDFIGSKRGYKNYRRPNMYKLKLPCDNLKIAHNIVGGTHPLQGELSNQCFIVVLGKKTRAHVCCGDKRT